MCLGLRSFRFKPEKNDESNINHDFARASGPLRESTFLCVSWRRRSLNGMEDDDASGSTL